MFAEIALVIIGAAGVLGWYMAYRARGEVIDGRSALAQAKLDAGGARQVAYDAAARAVVAESKLLSAVSQVTYLTAQLDSERKDGQAMVDDLAKSGVPVGPLVVDHAFDRLYPDGGGSGGGTPAGSGGDSVGVSGGPAPAAGTPGKS